MIKLQKQKFEEKELYPLIRYELGNKFKSQGQPCYLEITADGKFSETIKSAIREDIIFTFLKKKASPDITGWTSAKEFIVAEVKNEKITIQDIYQTKMYMDLFRAKYGFLISTEPLPTEIKRLHERFWILNTTSYGYTIVTLTQFDPENKKFNEESWFPESPFKK